MQTAWRRTQQCTWCKRQRQSGAHGLAALQSGRRVGRWRHACLQLAARLVHAARAAGLSCRSRVARRWRCGWHERRGTAGATALALRPMQRVQRSNGAACGIACRDLRQAKAQARYGDGDLVNGGGSFPSNSMATAASHFIRLQRRSYSTATTASRQRQRQRWRLR